MREKCLLFRRNKASHFLFFPPRRWIVNTLGGRSQTQRYLTQLLRCLESYYQPANVGVHSVRLMEFMSRLAGCFVKRVHRERYKKPKWGFRPAR